MSHNDHRGDGDGWVECRARHRHWGLYGAAGLLAHRGSPRGGHEVLLQHRAEWSHFGGTWGLLGGARTSTEPVVAAALREAAEEGAVAAQNVRVDGCYVDDHGGWTYTTVLATASAGLAARASGGESLAVAWHPADGLRELPLHPGFESTWAVLEQALSPLSLVVDAANVMGSRPDGWWKDRAGAARRLIVASAAAAHRGLPGHALPAGVARAPLQHWWPHVSVVVEGAARAAADLSGSVELGDLTVVVAPGSGDDTILDCAAASASPTIVVTADRELRRRCAEVGAASAGPRWWLDLVTGPG